MVVFQHRGIEWLPTESAIASHGSTEVFNEDVRAEVPDRRPAY